MIRPCLFTAAASAGVLALAACGPAEDRPDSDQNALAVAAVTATTPQASLSDEDREEFRQLARSYLDEAGAQMAEGHAAAEGFEDEVVALQPTQTHNWRINLRQGQAYRIIGACDNECQNMDFHLIDSTGKVVEQDTLDDSFPVVSITPPADGEYTVRFTMVTCTIAPCFAAGRVYARS